MYNITVRILHIVPSTTVASFTLSKYSNRTHIFLIVTVRKQKPKNPVRILTILKLPCYFKACRRRFTLKKSIISIKC